MSVEAVDRVPKDWPWPAVIGGFDATEGLPLEPGSVDLMMRSTPYWAKAKYSTDNREMGAGSLPTYVDDHVRLAERTWDLVRPGGWMVTNLGDTRANTGGAGGQVKAAGQATYRPDKVYRSPHPVTGEPRLLRGGQWLQVPARVALAVQDRTDWQLVGEVVWDKKRVPRSDNSLHHHQRAGRPGLQTEMIQLWWRPGPPGSRTYDAPYLESVGCRGNIWSIAPNTVRPPWASLADNTKAWPHPLCERIIRALSRPGDLVVDDFAGYGTTGRVASWLGRRSMCFDLYTGGASLSTAALALDDAPTGIPSEDEVA